MEAPLKPKAKVSSLSRVMLTEENGKHLQEWIGQLGEFCPGIRVNKQDIINWLVSTKGARLTAGDLKEVKDRFFDDIELAEWALQQLRAARARNEKLALADLVRGSAPYPSRKARSPNKKPLIEAPQIEQSKDGPFDIDPIATPNGGK